MFAQLLVTVAVSWLLAEVLCRWILGRPAWTILAGLLGLDGQDGEHREDPEAEELRGLLLARRLDLERELERLELAAATSEVSRELVKVRAELVRIRRELAAFEGKGPAGPGVRPGRGSGRASQDDEGSEA